jgi:general secretion pathway protein L
MSLMPVINIQNLWRTWLSEIFSWATDYDAFAELADCRLTELQVTETGYRLIRRSDLTTDRQQRALAESEDLTILCNSLAKSESVSVSVGLKCCLVRQVEVPLIAARKIAQLLELDLARVTPFQPEDVYSAFFSRNQAANRTSLPVEHVIIRRNILAPVLAAIEGRGASAVAITVRDGTDPALPIALAPDGAPFHRKRAQLWLKAAAASVGLAACAAAILAAIAINQQIETLAAIQISTATYEQQAIAVRQKLDTIKAASLEISTLAAWSSGGRQILLALEELSRLLPNDSHLDGLSIEGQHLLADGTAKAPERLITIFESSNHFANVAFAAPVFRNAGEDESRFSIKMDLEGTVYTVPQ